MKKIENPCGTTTGYKRHRKEHTAPCELCLEAVSEYKKQWKINNPEKAKKRNRDYYTKNSEKINEKNRRFRDENPEKVKQYQEQYRLANKEARENYRLSNLDKFRGYSRKRKAWKLNNGHEVYAEQQVIEKWGTDCHICSTPIDFDASRKVGIKNWEFGFHIDHLVALANGGSDTLDNVRPAHAICNLRKNAKDLNKQIANGN